MPRINAQHELPLRERFQQLNQTTSDDAVAAAHRQRVTFKALVISPFVVFLRTYWQQKAWRQGIPGLIAALFAAYSAFVRTAKLWEQQQVPTSVPPSSPSANG
ncbi:MAG: hypothetical protein AB7G75_29690 [Candidatus Binatia bacterium]